MFAGPLQNLAKSNPWQILYHRAKEINIRLFNNETDFSNVQITFLYYLELFSMLYQDLHMEEEYLSEQVIDDPLRCEAYLLYRRINKKTKKNKSNKKPIIDNAGEGSLIFTRGKNN